MSTEEVKKKRSKIAVKSHHLPVWERIENFKEVNLGYVDEQEIRDEADRCVNCRKPKCMEACPGGFDINSMLTNVQEGNLAAAADIVNTFYCIPSSFNRICPAFCQDACVVGKKGEPIQILNIKRYLADHFDKPREFYEKQPTTGSRVAIIGSGPAGITAAYELAKLGHKVTVYEKNQVLGGMLAVGIPEYRLNNNLLLSEIHDLENLGIDFITGQGMGSDFELHDLFDQGYKAILIAIGAHKPKFMKIPGEDLDGNIHAIDFLREVALGNRPQIGKNVMVIGGGDVAIDAVRVATRLGSKAFIVYRRSREEMPATKDEIQETENEGIEIKYLTNPVKIIGFRNKVAKVQLIKMELGEPDESGRRRPVPVENSEYFMDVDTVIQAISQEPDSEEFLDDGFKLSKWNTFEVEDSLKTNVYGVFAAGDDVSGPKTAIEAIAQGKQAAKSIHQYLEELSPSEEEFIIQN